jgi:hypothetical protein
MKYATEKEMIENCNKNPCKHCGIANRCSMFERLFGYLPDAPFQQVNHADSEWAAPKQSVGGVLIHRSSIEI